MLGPVLEEVAAEQDAVKICKIDTDKEMALALKYNVASIPTLLLFKNREVADYRQRSGRGGLRRRTHSLSAGTEWSSAHWTCEIHSLELRSGSEVSREV